MLEMEGKIFSVCISAEKGTKKREVPFVRLIPGWGIERDAHAGAGHRQVSLLPLEEIEEMKRWIPGLKPGDFAENIITSGVKLDLVEVGDRIDIHKNVSLEVTQIGKECHSGCEIQRIVGHCIMPEKGIFARVLKGGFIQKNDLIRKKKPRVSHRTRNRFCEEFHDSKNSVCGKNKKICI